MGNDMNFSVKKVGGTARIYFGRESAMTTMNPMKAPVARAIPIVQARRLRNMSPPNPQPDLSTGRTILSQPFTLSKQVAFELLGSKGASTGNRRRPLPMISMWQRSVRLLAEA